MIKIISWVQEGTAYLLDPAHRLMAIGIGLFIIVTLGRFIVKGIKLILFVVIIFIIFYFGLKYLATPI